MAIASCPRTGSSLAGLSGFERALENESLIARSLRPPAQLVMTGWLGAGNERVYPGRDGWLFYRPDVEYVTGPRLPRSGAAQAARQGGAGVDGAAAAGSAPGDRSVQARPRGARDHARRRCRRRSSRASTRRCSRGATRTRPASCKTRRTRRSSTTSGAKASWCSIRRRRWSPRAGTRPAVPRDRHPLAARSDGDWSRNCSAASSSAQVRVCPHGADPGYRDRAAGGAQHGRRRADAGPAGRPPLFPPESVWLRRVLQPDGSPWRSSRDADVLLLGDSFSNIYSLESMGWGTSAGFAEQLSYALRRPVDRLVQNDEGAFATRAMLQRDPDRLTASASSSTSSPRASWPSATGNQSLCRCRARDSAFDQSTVDVRALGGPSPKSG